MLQFFRSNAQGMLGKTIVGAIVVVFTLWGAQSIVAISTSNNAPVTVNGVDISEYEVSKLTDIQRRNIQAQMGDAYDPSVVSDAMIRQSVISNLVNQEIEWQTALNFGLAMSDEIVTEVIVQTPTFHVEGKFDTDAYTRILGQYGYAPKEYKEMVRQDLINFQLKRGILDSGFILDHEVDQVKALESQVRDFSVLQIQPAQYLSDVTLEDGDVEAYYEENKGQYRTQELLSVDYVVLNREMVANSIKVTEQEIEQAYDNYVTQQAGFNDKSIAHILITSEDRSDSEAKALATDLKSQIESGVSFAELAKEYSEDPGSAPMGGDLGVYLPGMFVAEFDEAITLLTEAGQITGPVKTDFGYHVIQLSGISQAEIASFESQRLELETRILDRKISDELLILQEDFTNIAFSESSLAPIADQFELVIETSELFSREGGTGIFENAAAVNAAYDPVVVNDGENSTVVSLDDGSLLVMHLNAYEESDYLALEDVRDEIVAVLTNTAAEQKALSESERIIAELATANSIESVSTQQEWTRYEAIGRGATDVSNEIVAQVFKTAKPSDDSFTVSSVSLFDGSVAVIALQGVSVNSETFNDSDVEGIKSYLSSLASESDYEQWFRQIADETKIQYR